MTGGTRRWGILASVLFATAFLAASLAQGAVALNSKALSPAYRNLTVAQADGTLSQKEAVLLKARLLFAPDTIPADSPYKLAAGESLVYEKCGASFYKEVHMVYDQLAPAEKSWLASLSPDLQAIMTARGRGPAPTEAGALPVYADLDKTVTGANCIVHYTLTGGNACANATYAQLVKTYVDAAVKAEVKYFRKAFTEKAAVGDTKLHLYIIEQSALGEWVDVSQVVGQQRSGYIKIKRNIDTEYGAATWQLWLKTTCYHEYFHGVQSAYNYASDLWFLEGTAQWAELYFAKSTMGLADLYADANGIVKVPTYPIWYDAGMRKYSTSALVWYFTDKYGKAAFLKSYFEKSETGGNDAITLLTACVDDEGGTFTDEFKNFYVAMAANGIKSISKYMCKVGCVAEIADYGVAEGADVSVAQTGAQYLKFTPSDSDFHPGSLILTMTPSSGAPTGLMLVGGKAPALPMAAPRSFVAGFGLKAQEVLMVVVSTTYGGKALTWDKFKYSANVPYLRVSDISADSPITGGDSSQINITYDLLQTVPGVESFSAASASGSAAN